MIIASPAGSAAEEQEDGRQEHGCPGSPGETECVFTNVGCEAGIPESVAHFDEDGAVDLLEIFMSGKGYGNLRHKGGCESKPEEGEAESEAGESRCKTAAWRK
jgi:hypothetical protein